MAKRELVRKIDQEIGGVGTGGGAFVAGSTRHRMLSPTHSDSDAGDTPADGEVMVFEDLWQAMSATEWLELIGGMFLGRIEGNHVGLVIREHDEGTAHVLEVTNSGGEQIFAAGYVKDVPNSFWWRLGQASGDQIQYTNDGTRDGIEKPGVWSLPADIVSGYLPIEYGQLLPDAFDRDPASFFALQSPGDPYSFILYLRDNLDSWQRLIGAGYAAVHSHSSDETGGYLSGFAWEDQQAHYIFAGPASGADAQPEFRPLVLEDLPVEYETLNFVMDGGGAVIATGVKGDIDFEDSYYMQSWRLLADQSGYLTVDLWVEDYADYPPTDADSITNGNEPALDGYDKAEDTDLGDWASTTILAGQTMRINVDSAATVERATLALKLQRA